MPVEFEIMLVNAFDKEMPYEVMDVPVELVMLLELPLEIKMP